MHELLQDFCVTDLDLSSLKTATKTTFLGLRILVVKSCSSGLKNANKHFSGSFNGGWVSQYGGADQFLQIDLDNVTKVTRIATQGRYDAGWWTKTYTLSYSNDGAAFTAYKNGEVTLEYSDPRPYNII